MSRGAPPFAKFLTGAWRRVEPSAFSLTMGTSERRCTVKRKREGERARRWRRRFNVAHASEFKRQTFYAL